MFVLNDLYCNAYVREDGQIVARRCGESVVFESREEAEIALAEVNVGRLSPAWIEEL